MCTHTRVQVLLFRGTLLSYLPRPRSFLERGVELFPLLLPSPRSRFREPVNPPNKLIKRAILEKRRKEGKRGRKLVVADGAISAGRQAPHQRRVSWSNWSSLRFQSCCCCCCESPRFEDLSLPASKHGEARRVGGELLITELSAALAPSPCTLSVHVLPAAHNKLPFFSHLPLVFLFLLFFLPPSASNRTFDSFASRNQRFHCSPFSRFYRSIAAIPREILIDPSRQLYLSIRLEGGILVSTTSFLER